MSTFLQLHLLISYPPANLNRDDLGRPKTAIFGGKQRLRVSSQALKRAWRTGPMFDDMRSEFMGQRTKKLGVEVYKEMIEAGISEETAKKFSQEIAKTFAKTKKAKKDNDMTELETEQLVHVSPTERAAIRELIQNEMVNTEDWDKNWNKQLLQSESKAADIAMFGRMLADNPKFNVDAAVQVAHAITIHEVDVEDDYFSAVDDLNTEDGGAGHIGEANFASGVFYLYVNINQDQLIENLSGDKELAAQTIIALAKSCAQVAPSGKQNSFAAHAYAHYMLAERGQKTPRQLSMAFLNGNQENGQLDKSVNTLLEMRDKMDRAYGQWASGSQSLNVLSGEGSMDDIVKFIQEGFNA